MATDRCKRNCPFRFLCETPGGAFGREQPRMASPLLLLAGRDDTQRAVERELHDGCHEIDAIEREPVEPPL